VSNKQEADAVRRVVEARTRGDYDAEQAALAELRRLIAARQQRQERLKAVPSRPRRSPFRAWLEREH
jgi:hypothetical protein